MADLGPTTIFGDLTVNGSIGGAIRIAYVRITPTDSNIVDVYLDTDITGEEVSVTCSITDGNDLNQAWPHLTTGDQIFVAKIGGTWYCLTVFHTFTS